MRRRIPEHFKRDWSSNNPVRMDGTALVHAQGRPWRIMRNSSVPALDTAPTVALRAEMMPLSGATTLVYFRRSCWLQADQQTRRLRFWKTAPDLNSACSLARWGSWRH